MFELTSMLRLLTSSLLVTISSGSFCGDSAIPFSLEVLPDGQPVLGCARPTCFGWTHDSQSAIGNSAFYQINGQWDGFLRPDQNLNTSMSGDRFHSSQTAICEPAFGSIRCPGLNQWVGGIAPNLNPTFLQTLLQCCSLEGLLESEDRGVASLRPREIVVGGEVLSSGVQIGFDYISDVVKTVRLDRSVQYDVSIRRMPCTALPEAVAPAKKKDDAAQAFQAPNVPVDVPLLLPLTATAVPNAIPEHAQEEIIEEIIEDEAVQLPTDTQFPKALQLQLQPPPLQHAAFQASDSPASPPLFDPVPPQAAWSQFVQAPVAYHPPPVACYGGSDCAQWCFSGDMTVELMDGSTKRMDELTKQDWVLSVSEERLEYVSVDCWLHRLPAQEAVFNEFELEDGKTIKLTDKHYIFKGDCGRVGAGPLYVFTLSQTAVTADQVHVGDCLYTVAEDKGVHEVRVVSSRKVSQKGIYAPMTSSGRIIVNGVHASCHNIMQDNYIIQSAFEYFDVFHGIYSAFFGVSTDDVTPTGLSTILEIAELIVPKNFLTM